MSTSVLNLLPFDIFLNDYASIPDTFDDPLTLYIYGEPIPPRFGEPIINIIYILFNVNVLAF